MFSMAIYFFRFTHPGVLVTQVFFILNLFWSIKSVHRSEYQPEAISGYTKRYIQSNKRLYKKIYTYQSEIFKHLKKNTGIHKVGDNTNQIFFPFANLKKEDQD